MSTQPEQSPEYIEEQIAETRSQLSETVEELQNRLSPNDMLEDAINYVKTNEALRRNVVTTIRDNPIPVCLMGIGLIWLIASGASGPRHRGSLGYEGSFDAAPSAGDPRFSDHPEGPAPQTYPSGTETSGSGKEQAKQKVDEAKTKASHAAETVKNKL